jgi:hypothetical protein
MGVRKTRSETHAIYENRATDTTCEMLDPRLRHPSETSIDPRTAQTHATGAAIDRNIAPMLHHARPMTWSSLSLALGLALLAACTKHNPLDCTNGTCTDPAFPFCDVGGEIDHTPLTCIAVACQPSAFAACRGDTALTCNAAGTDYDAIQCDHGCDATFGCRVCDAGQSVCTNGQAQTCDATGKVTASQACPLGCFQDQPRCRDIDPSNGLAPYLDMAASAPDLVLSDGDVILTDKGIKQNGQTKTPLPSFFLNAPQGGTDLRVVIANHVQLTGHVTVLALQPNGLGISPSLAIVANDKITIDGNLDFTGPYLNGFTSSPGAVTFPECRGGTHNNNFSTTHVGAQASGGGGGGHATPGGAGGTVGSKDVQVLYVGGTAGGASGNPTLVPLRGGCSGGADGVDPDAFVSGGGAVQLSSRVAIEINSGGTLNLNGATPPLEGGPTACFGGGAGGGILLEAPAVVLDDSASLLVNGGAGCNLAGFPTPTSLTTQPSHANACISAPGQNIHCTQSGDGAGLDGPATSGGDLPYDPAHPNDTYLAGGGGGGLGFIRINTATGTYTKANTAIESGVLTTGTIGTR